MTRTKITADMHNECHIEFDCPYTGERRTLDLHAPRGGGYVRNSASGKQICRGLSDRGVTLDWSGRYPLIEMIRAEYHRMKAAERRELAR